MARPEIENKISFFIELFSTKHDKERTTVQTAIANLQKYVLLDGHHKKNHKNGKKKTSTWLGWVHFLIRDY